MNLFLLIAAMALFAIGIMHSVVAEWKGERRLVWRITQLTLFDSSDAKDLLAKRIVRLAWHLTSLIWCGCAVVLAYIAFVEALESIVETIEGGEVPLADLVSKFEKGNAMLKLCQARLKEAELKIETLKLEGGHESFEEFNPDKDNS